MHKDDHARTWLLTDERRERILAALRRDGRVLATDLSKALGVSDDTIRRDLDALAEMGLLQRVHGGALSRVRINEDYAARQADDAIAKQSIARATAALVRPGQVVVLDGGTTALAIAQQLPKTLEATVITTSPPIAVALAAHLGIQLITIGGRLYRYAMVAVGASTVAELRTIRADLCILGVLALHPEAGISVVDREEAEVKRAMIEGAANVVAPTTQNKLGTVAPFIVGPTTSLTHLVTDAEVSEQMLIPYRALGLTVIQA
ncbi:MAG TPA: DeoR/GlpR family DNA-binding transcription regulator [Ktedonobacterales bacterium]|nr:DeoR/GlpR family DNA-binding transcription regulator [Ktedonobacterales bacterium]